MSGKASGITQAGLLTVWDALDADDNVAVRLFLGLHLASSQWFIFDASQTFCEFSVVVKGDAETFVGFRLHQKRAMFSKPASTPPRPLHRSRSGVCAFWSIDQLSGYLLRLGQPLDHAVQSNSWATSLSCRTLDYDVGM